jgi:hypothetical protein
MNDQPVSRPDALGLHELMDRSYALTVQFGELIENHKDAGLFQDDVDRIGKALWDFYQKITAARMEVR